MRTGAGSMKKPSLFALKAEAAETGSTVDPISAEPKKSARPPSREGKRVLSIYLPPEALKQLRMISINHQMSAQALGEETINLLFEKHRLNGIA
jgi:hypothetical protein